MNTEHLHQIFSNYIKRFAELNDKEHGEYYKWRIAERFHNEMDRALDSSDEMLPTRLYNLRKLTENFIDSYTAFLWIGQVCRKRAKNSKRNVSFVVF